MPPVQDTSGTTPLRRRGRGEGGRERERERARRVRARASALNRPPPLLPPAGPSTRLVFCYYNMRPLRSFIIRGPGAKEKTGGAAWRRGRARALARDRGERATRAAAARAVVARVLALSLSPSLPARDDTASFRLPSPSLLNLPTYDDLAPVGGPFAPPSTHNTPPTGRFCFFLPSREKIRAAGFARASHAPTLPPPPLAPPTGPSCSSHTTSLH